MKMTKMSFPQYCMVSWIRKSVNTILHKTKIRRKGIWLNKSYYGLKKAYGNLSSCRQAFVEDNIH